MTAQAKTSQTRTLSSLAGAYERIEKTQRLPDSVEHLTESEKVAQAEARKHPLYTARYAAEQVTKAFMLIAEQEQLTPPEMIYAITLARLNVTEADDCPLTDAERKKVTDKAIKYYQDNKPNAVDPANVEIKRRK